MPKIKKFQDFECWKQARILTRQVYKVTKREKFKRDIRLASQIQSASGSVMANIAEGFIRRSNKEFIQFLFIAMSSAAEVQSHLYIALDQEYINKNEFNEIFDQAKKTSIIISGLLKYLLTKLKSTQTNPNKPR